MAMNTVFLHLSEEAIKRLNKLRGWRKVSRSAILREAVEQYLERQQFPVRKAKGGRQKAAGKGTRQLVLKNYVSSIRNDKSFFIHEYKKPDALILVLIQGCFT